MVEREQQKKEKCRARKIDVVEPNSFPRNKTLITRQMRQILCAQFESNRWQTFKSISYILINFKSRSIDEWNKTSKSNICKVCFAVCTVQPAMPWICYSETAEREGNKKILEQTRFQFPLFAQSNGWMAEAQAGRQNWLAGIHLFSSHHPCHDYSIIWINIRFLVVCVLSAQRTQF